MVTFSGWLKEQRDRSDQVGWAAKYWRDLADTPKLSNPGNIERHMRDRGLFESQEGLAEAWEVTMTEYRQQRIVASARDAGITPEQLAQPDPLPGMPSPGEIVASATQAGVLAGARVPSPGVSLAGLDAKLNAILAHLGIAQPVMPVETPFEPIDWQAAWDAADHEAVAE
jgi:hypothetical protein